MPDVRSKIRRFRMLFRIAGNPQADPGKILLDETDQFFGEMKSVLGRSDLSLFRRMWLILFGALLVVWVSVPAGIALSYQADLPTGPAVVCVYAGLFVITSIAGAVHTSLR